jgi:hypothetical protein
MPIHTEVGFTAKAAPIQAEFKGYEGYEIFRECGFSDRMGRERGTVSNMHPIASRTLSP